MIASYRVGDYQAAEAHILLQSRLHKISDPKERTIILLHGRTWTAREIQQTPTLAVLMDKLVRNGYTGLSIDAGQGDTWGNTASETAVGNAITWAKGSGNITDPTKKVVLLGHSMGGFVGFNYAKNHSSDIAGIIGGAPGTNLARWYNDATYGPAVNTAYSGNYAVNSVGRDPILYAGSFPSIPTKLYSVADDSFIPPAEVQAFHDSLPSGNQKSLVALPNGGHQDFWDRIDVTNLLDWLNNLAW